MRAASLLHLGSEHTELMLSAAEAQAIIPNLPAIYDEPFAELCRRSRPSSSRSLRASTSPSRCRETAVTRPSAGMFVIKALWDFGMRCDTSRAASAA